MELRVIEEITRQKSVVYSIEKIVTAVVKVLTQRNIFIVYSPREIRENVNKYLARTGPRLYGRCT